jgi:glycosyltransferase involved in cell wall biosynthesis
LLIANSNWTAGHLKALGANEVMVLYPPVADGLAALPWDERRQGFVAISRIAPEKRIEDMIEIVEGLRKRGHGVSLCLVGRLDGDSYSERVRKLSATRRDWVTLAGPAYGDGKAMALGNYRFGLHAAFGEAFGIGVAEMTKAGCITFVRDGAGPAEIVAQPELTFSTIPEAILKIDRVLKEPGLQDGLRSRLEQQARRYSAEEFSRKFRSVVEKFLSL